MIYGFNDIKEKVDVDVLIDEAVPVTPTIDLDQVYPVGTHLNFSEEMDMSNYPGTWMAIYEGSEWYTYVRLSGEEAYASFDDQTLRFFRDEANKYSNGQVVDGVTYYAGFENDTSGTKHRPWGTACTDVMTKVVFDDYIKPKRIDGWFRTSCARFSLDGVPEVSSNLQSITNLDRLITSDVTTMYQVFYGCDYLTEIDLSHFDTRNVTNMSGMFGYCNRVQYLNLFSFDTSKVTTMYNMFSGCISLSDISGLDGLDTSNVKEMEGMFRNCTSLERLTMLYAFNTSSVTGRMANMFYGCESLTSIDLSNFDTSSITSMRSMFEGCKLLTELNLSNFDTSNVTDMGNMFSMCNAIQQLDISNFDTTNVTNMYSMFSRCSNMTSLTFGNDWSTANVTNMSYMFDECRKLLSIDLSIFNTSSVTNMVGMFYHCNALTSINLSTFDTRNVANMGSMFMYCQNVTNITFGNDWSTANVTNMYSMFYDCRLLTSIDLSKFDTSQVTSMGNMFENCYELTRLDLSMFDTSKVKNMAYMFCNDKKLTSIDVSNFNTYQVTTFESMFDWCSSLTYLDISSFNSSNVTNMKNMFANCENLSDIYISSLWSTASVTTSSSMFRGCTNLPNYTSSAIDASMAKPTTEGGYLTNRWYAEISSITPASIFNDFTIEIDSDTYANKRNYIIGNRQFTHNKTACVIVRINPSAVTDRESDWLYDVVNNTVAEPNNKRLYVPDQNSGLDLNTRYFWNSDTQRYELYEGFTDVSNYTTSGYPYTAFTLRDIDEGSAILNPMTWGIRLVSTPSTSYLINNNITSVDITISLSDNMNPTQ